MPQHVRKDLDQLRAGQTLSKCCLVGVGLSDPRGSLRSVPAWCEEFAIDEVAPICETTVSVVR
eukprot:5481266-Alexandrium_andersonii.AAC.1